MEKECFKCGIVKPLNEYYKAKKMVDGHLGKCKECTKKDCLDNYRHNMQDHDWRMKERARGRVKQHQYQPYRKPPSLEKQREYQQKWREKNALKLAAHQAVNKAVHAGTLVRQLCEICNDVAETHHEDYNKPLEVKWLCVKHHKELHHKTD